MDREELRGKTAIITGGSNEVAAAVALALAREGVQICLSGKHWCGADDKKTLKGNHSSCSCILRIGPTGCSPALCIYEAMDRS
jgi:hypothetical protein